MIFTLLWLSVSTPFVYQTQQLVKAELAKVDPKSKALQEDDPNPFSSTTEEKSESGVSNISEYLHEPHQVVHPVVTLTKYYKCHPANLYFAFDPELLSPPPEA